MGWSISPNPDAFPQRNAFFIVDVQMEHSSRTYQKHSIRVIFIYARVFAYYRFRGDR